MSFLKQKRCNPGALQHWGRCECYETSDPQSDFLDQLPLEHLLEHSNLFTGWRPEGKSHHRWKVAMETFHAGFEAIERQDCAETAFLQHLPTALAAEGALDSCTTNQSISLGEQAITIGINKKLETVPLGVTSEPWDAIIKVLDVVTPLLFSQAGPGLSLAPRDSSCTFQPLC